MLNQNQRSHKIVLISMRSSECNIVYNIVLVLANQWEQNPISLRESSKTSTAMKSALEKPSVSFQDHPQHLQTVFSVV